VKQRANEATMRADALALLNAVEELMRGGTAAPVTSRLSRSVVEDRMGIKIPDRLFAAIAVLVGSRSDGLGLLRRAIEQSGEVAADRHARQRSRTG
jgi:hypothetical protein